jgi:hypothetical protein
MYCSITDHLVLFGAMMFWSAKRHIVVSSSKTSVYPRVVRRNELHDEHVFSACVARLRLLRLSAKAYSSSPPSSAPLLLNSRSSMGLLCQSKWRVTIYSAPPSVAAPSPGMQKKRLAIAQKLGDKTKTTMQQEPVDSALRIPMLCWCASWSECLSSFIFLY